MKMQMTDKVFAIGSWLIFVTAGFAVAVFPAFQLIRIPPSDIARRRTPLEERGRQVFIQNGCTYCHSQYIRPQDWDHGAVRVSQAGDYVYDSPQLLGSERTGPDLSQEGGVRSDDWHLAHFMNPRFTRPASEMPQFVFLSHSATERFILKGGLIRDAKGAVADDEVTALIAYIQSLGGKMADARMKRLDVWRKAMQKAYLRGEDKNFAYIQTLVPEPWRRLPNPYPPTPAALQRGRFIYYQECVGCHGNFGDGNGPAAKYLFPKPANFSALRRIGASGGLLYYQIMNGITGTAMMSFKRDLESAKIWDVSNYIAVNFIGHSDGDTAPHGVDESQEPVDPNAPGPPDPDTINTPPPTSPALQPDQNAIWRHRRPTRGFPTYRTKKALAAPGGAVGHAPYYPPKGVKRR
ncbi:MAG TPA: cbb3-type cytochrome c oxidase subunit II [Armatimonadota bacterium]|nr:cbb3-type cytochrome c oxidase subunit II [Armatimonadota bacterium]